LRRLFWSNLRLLFDAVVVLKDLAVPDI
jgi:hypothetical protein